MMHRDSTPQPSSATRLKRAAIAVVSVNRVLGGALTEDALHAQVCQALVAVAGYRLAWVGLPQDDGLVAVAAAAGEGHDYLSDVIIGWRDDALGQGPTGRALRTGQAAVQNRISTAKSYRPWSEKALKRGFQSSVALPIILDEKPVAALNLYAAESDAFDQQETVLLAEVADLVALGLRGIRHRAERDQALDELGIAREVLQAIYLASPDAIFLHGANGRIIHANQRATAMYGATLDELKTLPPSTFMGTTHTFTDAAKRIDRAISGEPVDFEWTARRVDDKEFPVEVRLRRLTGVAPVRPDAPVVVAIVRDLSVQHRVQAELLKIQKLESLGVMSGGIAHDFNNLLTVVIGNLSLARLDTPADSPVTPFIQDAETAAMRGSQLTRQLLTLAKGDTSERRSVALGPVLHEVVQLGLRGSQIKPSLDIDPDLPPVWCDEGQMAQVFQNLVINARQATTGGKTLSIRAHKRVLKDDEVIGLLGGDYVQIDVVDHGCGIPPDRIGRIFDPFYTTRSEGTGLGLAVAYSIIRRHGGHIDVLSSLAQGTQFAVLLPATTNPTRQILGESGHFVAVTGRALVMDDQDLVRKVLGRILGKMDLAVDFFDDGEAALAALLSSDYQVAFLDLTVPGGMGGIAVARALRAHRTDVRLVACSGYSDQDMGTIEALFDAFIPKPFRMSDVARVLREVLID